MNTKQLLPTIAAALCMAATLSSCSWDDESQLTYTVTLLAQVQYEGGPDSTLYLLDDYDQKCWPSNASDLKVKPAGGSRVYVVAQYTQNEVRPGYDIVLYLTELHVLDVYDVTQADSTTIANAALDDTKLQTLSLAWVSSRYLNIDYQFSYKDKPESHTIALLCDSATLAVSPLTLRLVRNNQGDAGSLIARNIVSFDLESLRGLVPTDSIAINFEVFEEYKSAPILVRLEYKFQ
ncbi:MAG: hypothetical protein LBS94_02390 [Prevotellaceae bacterium]|jgi:hypothetical protein|nr:hypothetical protein [Prevotellaceae bacterium]